MNKFNKKYPFSKSNRQIENVTSIKTNKKEVTKSQIANNPNTISTFTEIQYNFRCIETAQDLQALKRKTRKNEIVSYPTGFEVGNFVRNGQRHNI